MGKTSKIMYTIGRIFNIVAMVCCALLVIVGVIFTAGAGSFSGDIGMDKSELLIMGAAILGSGIGSFIVELVVSLLATKAQKTIGNGTTEKSPHIMMIVIGAIGGDIFYLLGGIFGLVAESRDDER